MRNGYGYDLRLLEEQIIIPDGDTFPFCSREVKSQPVSDNL